MATSEITGDPRRLKYAGLTLTGLGAVLLAMSVGIALITGELPERFRGVAMGAVFFIFGIVLLVRWQIAVRRSSADEAQ